MIRNSLGNLMILSFSLSTGVRAWALSHPLKFSMTCRFISLSWSTAQQVPSSLALLSEVKKCSTEQTSR